MRGIRLILKKTIIKFLILGGLLIPTNLIAEHNVPPQPIEVIETSVSSLCNSFRYELEKYDWDSEIAMAIMQAESSCVSDVVNWKDQHKTCTGSAGLFQIGCIHKSTEEMKDPYKNIKTAYEIYSKQGWSPWGAYTNGSYLKFL